MPASGPTPSTGAAASARPLYEPNEHVDSSIGSSGASRRNCSELAGRAGDDTRQPVFVFGIPRSGTTLVEQVLASHSRVHGAGELRVARQTSRRSPPWLAAKTGSCPAWTPSTPRDPSSSAERYRRGSGRSSIATVTQARPDRVVDKMPDNYLYLGLLALLFPRATLIHVRRDPRDIALSCWMTNFRSIRWANDRSPGRCGSANTTPHGPLASRLAGPDARGRLRTAGRRLRRRSAAAGLGVRARTGSRHACSSTGRAAGTNRERDPGPAAPLSRSLARWKPTNPPWPTSSTACQSVETPKTELRVASIN